MNPKPLPIVALCLLLILCLPGCRLPLPSTQEATPTPTAPPALHPPSEALVLDETRAATIIAAKQRLLAQHQIHLTTEEIRLYVRDTIQIKPWDFEKQQQFGRKLLAAHKEVLLEGKPAQEVAKRYTENFDEFRFWFSTLSMAKKEDLQSIEEHLYDSYEDMIEKSLPEWRETAELKALAGMILPVSESASLHWKDYLFHHLAALD